MNRRGLKCRVYQDRNQCIGSTCLWYDSKNRTCFIEHPLTQPQRSWKHESKLEMAAKRQAVYNIIHRLHELKIKQLLKEAEKEKINRKELKEILGDLENKGLVYSPKPGLIGCVDD